MGHKFIHFQAVSRRSEAIGALLWDAQYDWGVVVTTGSLADDVQRMESEGPGSTAKS
jgi:hypothetical protein